MLRPIAEVDDPAVFKVAVPNIEITVVTIDGDAASPELATIESEVVVIELQESDSSVTIFEHAVFECGFRERLALAGMDLEYRGIGETVKRQATMRNLRLESCGSLVVEPHAGFAPAIQLEADES